MIKIKTRVHIAADGALTGCVPGLPSGEHEAEIMLIDDAKPTARSGAELLLARVRAIQEEVARLPVLDRRDPDQIIGYDERGHFG
jgi:hypothetical protein